MLYTKIDNQLKKLSTCLIQTSHGVKKLSRLIMKQGQTVTTIAMPDSFPVLGEDKTPYDSGTLVFNGLGILFTQPGAHTFTIPFGVKKVHMVAIGAGGSGGLGGDHGSGGGGGGLAALNDVAVGPGQALDIDVGAGGKGAVNNTAYGFGIDGGDSQVQGYLLATGGKKGGSDGAANNAAGEGGEGNIIISNVDDFVVGTGGSGGLSNPTTGIAVDGGGGGGAAGYGGNGGNGAGDVNGAVSNASGGVLGGGGGGGTTNSGFRGGMGGGVGAFGIGSAGSGGASSTTGRNGFPGEAGSQHLSYPNDVFGAGSGGADNVEITVDAQNGAVLICWGEPLVLS
ncbi:hypothetical protein [uncultured Shewanella sp.]|uniref:glycine-rich domain-containing protein n=1 Tax=uncultured Shewanella sp. TaxID=173975 RepID=UPI00261C0F2A|nr:hypothetical protein [uncultured Shewanella sp.]